MGAELSQYLPIILIALAIALILAFLLLRPRQNVKLTDSAPVRPHMVQRREDPPREGRGIADGMAAATTDVTGQIIEAPVHANLPGASGPPDDLQQLKGVGPKFAQLLNDRGIVRYEQLARLTAGEVERLDGNLGPFRGRLSRDQIIDQADYLARGDTEGFEARFGKL